MRDKNAPEQPGHFPEPAEGPAGQGGSSRSEWTAARDALVDQTKALGYPPELGMLLAKELGSPKAMHRMTVYLREVKPRSEELIADELLAIKSDVDSWRGIKAARQANMRINELKYYGLDEE